MDKGKHEGILVRLLKYTAAHRLWLALRIIGAIAAAAADIVFAYITILIIDHAAIMNMPELKADFIIMGITVAIGILIAFINRYASGKLGANTVKDIRSRVVGHILDLPASYMDKTDSGQEISRMTIALNSIERFVENDLPEYILQPLRFIAAVVFLAVMNWKLLVFTVTIIPVIVIIAGILSNPIAKYADRIQRYNAGMNSVVQDGISGIQIIKAFNLKEIFQAKYNAVTENMLKESLLLEKRRAVIIPLNILIQLLPFLLCFGFGGLLVIRGQLSLGELIAFIQLMNYIVLPASMLPGLLAELNDLKGKTGYVLEILDVPEEEKPEADGKPKSDRKPEKVGKQETGGEMEGMEKQETGGEPERMGKPETLGRPEADRKPANGAVAAQSCEFVAPVEFKNVDFYYHKERKILDRISFTAGPKSLTALVSSSGGGKSTILKLICGFYKPVGGSITVFGKDVCESGLEELRRAISLVPQHVFLFPGTIAENISCGKPGAAWEEIVNAARSAGAHEFIMKLPEGYNTVIGEKAATLSGGQCQRLTIARALISERPILLLDEPASALDAESEASFYDCVNRISGERTVIMAAHRLSAVKRAQRIIVLDNGTIAAIGTHDELLGSCSVYRELYERQMKTADAVNAAAQEVGRI